MGWWDDDDDPYAESVLLRTIYGAQWDVRAKKWVCVCPQFRVNDYCRHTTMFRRTETVQLKEGYL